MKKVLFALALVPFIAGCFWNKKETVETTAAEVMPDSNQSNPEFNPDERPSEDMTGGMSESAVKAEMSDEK